jgi:hypothetical protein
MNAFVYPILDRVHRSNIPSLSSGREHGRDLGDRICHYTLHDPARRR